MDSMSNAQRLCSLNNFYGWPAIPRTLDHVKIVRIEDEYTVEVVRSTRCEFSRRVHSVSGARWLFSRNRKWSDVKFRSRKKRDGGKQTLKKKFEGEIEGTRGLTRDILLLQTSKGWRREVEVDYSFLTVWPIREAVWSTYLVRVTRSRVWCPANRVCKVRMKSGRAGIIIQFSHDDAGNTHLFETIRSEKDSGSISWLEMSKRQTANQMMSLDE